MTRTFGSICFALSLLSCSAPTLEGTNFACTTDADCTGGRICAPLGGQLACVGVDAGPIRLGMTAPLQGPSADLGIEMRRGIEAAFQQVNEGGGVFGRRLELDSRNDNYDPAAALENTIQLLDIQQMSADSDTPDIRGPNGVLAMLGNVGTPTMLATAPVATKNHVVYFAPFTGAQVYLRDETKSPFVYNYRAGYYDETEAMVDYLMSFRTPRVITGDDSYRRILAFTQDDSFGNSGYDGFVTAYNTNVAPIPQPNSDEPNPSIRRVVYQRENVASVDPAIIEAEAFLSDVVAQVSATTPVAIFMIDTYQPANKFIRAVKDWLNADVNRATLLDVLFINVSFVGSDALAQALVAAPETYVDVTDSTGQTERSYAEGVMVTQVVPYYQSQAPGVTRYRNAIRAFDDGIQSFTSLEGFIAANLFIEGLRSANAALDSQSLIDAFDTRISDLDLGIGTLLTFSSTNHQASHTVWGSEIQSDGTFTVPFVWNPADRIIPGSN